MHPKIKSNRKVRHVVSLLAGNLIQGTGIGLGCIFLWLSAQPNSTFIRVTTMLVGYLLIYFTSHSFAHYVVGRLGRIRFTHYSVGGSTHASSYPPILRQIFERLPFFAAHTDSQSLKSAHPTAKALMFGAGMVGTALFCSLAALFVFRANVPGGLTLLIVNIVWQISSIIAEMRPGGDFAKAAKALKF